MKTIEEYNKLIAEFMGLTIITDGISWFDTNYNALPRYDLYWDWLMPVVQKIEKTWRGEDLFCVKIAFNTCIITQERLMDKPIIRAESTNRIDRTKIEAVWSAVVNFIEWYNNN